MTPLEVRKLLFDVQEACALIAQFLGGRSYEDYSASALLRSAVERQLATVGEALRQALSLDPALADRISDTRAIIGLRNRLIHGYANIAHDVVWRIATKDVPALRAEVSRVLAEA